MDPHRLAELRSLAYHRAVVERLREDPSRLELAKTRVREWRQRGFVRHYAELWERALLGPREDLFRLMVADDEEGRAMRQATPFAGFVDARERWRIWERVRREADGAR